MRARDEREFTQFVAARMPALRRSAYLLCGDPHGADDLVSTALAKLFRRWRQVSRLDYPDAYLRRMLMTTYLDERRRPWRHEHPVESLPEPAPLVEDTDVVDRVTLLRMLAQLPPRRRAVLVLRFLEDLSVEETAAALRCAPGTVKAHTSQGLADLRAMLGPQETAGPQRMPGPHETTGPQRTTLTGLKLGES
jgi:RNA polymerase sigma-70 factor (sigma-E family)